MFLEIYSLIIILPVLDFTTFFFFGLNCHEVLRHRSRKREAKFEELDVIFDQLVGGNSCISLRTT